MGVVTIGVAGVSIGYLPAITIFILVPVIVGTYYFGFRFGLLVAIVAAISELAAHIWLDTDEQHFEEIVSTVSHTFIYILSAALIAKLSTQLATISRLEKQRRSDLEIAQVVHRSVLDPIPDGYGRLSVGSKVVFARELGGDYCHIAGHDEKLFLCLADISGKSIAAALFTALLNQSITEALDRTTDLTSLVERVNSRSAATLPDDMFITMFCASISDNELTYVNAGHPPPLLYLKEKESFKELRSSQALPIGIVPEQRIESTTEPLRPREILLATTDGITESPAFRDEPQAKLADLLRQYADEEAQDITDHIFTKAVPNNQNSPIDDIIVVCIKKQL
jgi:serine phosphatase RsbU (regulator of sigma subunit)